ncbi:hypothetical protein [Amycolatopsis sp. lyj-112]|uniref:hypothetical protein n=1 Tax=Amycolatopsis sp. lyj-112 TaxID=2789288 RepID=UPI00397BAEF9
MHDGSIRKVWSDAELDEALADLHSEPEVKQDELSRAKASLLRAAGEVDDELLPASQPVRPAKKRPGSWRWIAAAAAAALVPGGVIVATNVFVGNDGQDTAAHATLAPSGDVLNDLRSEDIPLQKGQYRFITESTWRTQISDKTGLVYQLHEVVEKWLPAKLGKAPKRRFTRTGEIRWIKGDYQLARSLGETIPGAMSEVVYGTIANDPPVFPPLPTSGQMTGPATTSSAIVPPAATTTTTTTTTPSTPSTKKKDPPVADWLNPSTEFLAGLPTDPGQLLERLRLDPTTRAGAPLPGRVNAAPEMYEMAYNVLRAGYGFGALRVALGKALAQIPGITMQPGTTPDGQRVVTFSVTASTQTREMTLDLATANVVRNRVIKVSRDDGWSGQPLQETTTTMVITDSYGP